MPHAPDTSLSQLRHTTIATTSERLEVGGWVAGWMAGWTVLLSGLRWVTNKQRTGCQR